MSPVLSATLLLVGSNVWAALCILGAVYFLFRSPGVP